MSLDARSAYILAHLLEGKRRIHGFIVAPSCSSAFSFGFWCIHRKHNARMDLGSGLDGSLLEFDLVGVAIQPGLDTYVEIPYFGTIPQIARCFGKSFDQSAKAADGGVGVLCIPG